MYELPWIPGFWRRIGALAIDVIILGLFGLLLGLFFRNQFIELGGKGSIVGFLVALLYFGLLNSRLTGGQTIGKKVVNIRVVDRDDKPIDVPRAFLRYSILGVPFFLDAEHLAGDVFATIWIYPISMIIVGTVLSATYLYVFNRVTRQSIHDLAVVTYVVDKNAKPGSVGKIWRGHLVVVALLFAASGVLPVYEESLMQEEPFRELFATQAALNQHPLVSYAGVAAGRTTRRSTGEEPITTRYITAQAVLRENAVSDDTLARQLAAVVVNVDSEAANADVIYVVLMYGYSIGIASSWRSQTYSFDPTEFADST